MKIDTEKATIWGEYGSAMYHINDSGGLDLTDTTDNGLTDVEFLAAEKEICG